MASTSTSEKLRNHQSLRFKLEVINHYKNSPTPSKKKTAEDFRITRNQVGQYLRQENKKIAASDKRRSRVIVARKAPFEEEETQVLSWFQERRKAKMAVSGVDIQNEMRLLVDKEHPELKKKFQASNGWLKNFLKRKHLSRRRITSSGRPFPDDSLEIIEEYLVGINSLIDEFRFTSSEILGMDESSVYMDDPGNYTYDAINSQRVEVATTGKEKTKVSCAFTANLAGNKLDILAIVKRSTSLLSMTTPDNVVVAFSNKGNIYSKD